MGSSNQGLGKKLPHWVQVSLESAPMHAANTEAPEKLSDLKKKYQGPEFKLQFA